jgi:hypothetical protein
VIPTRIWCWRRVIVLAFGGLGQQGWKVQTILPMLPGAAYLPKKGSESRTTKDTPRYHSTLMPSAGLNERFITTVKTSNGPKDRNTPGVLIFSPRPGRVGRPVGNSKTTTREMYADTNNKITAIFPSRWRERPRHRGHRRILLRRKGALAHPILSGGCPRTGLCGARDITSPRCLPAQSQIL